MPQWVISADSVYSKTHFVAATGYASSRQAAENNALAALTAFFGQSVLIERQAASSYQQAIVNGVIDGWVDTAEMRNSIKTISAMDNLMGAEIKEVWYDSKDTYYAVAVMEKERAVQIYGDLLRANLNIINNLVDMTIAQKNSLEGVIRYLFAAVVADINISYINIIRLLDSAPPQGITSGEQYRLEAQNIIKTIPISINVTNDRNARIHSAFAKCFADWGFIAASGNARYVLNVNTVLTPVNLPNNPNIFCRIELTTSLRDTALNLVLLPFSFNSREGHISEAEAENRAVAAAERAINEEFAGILSSYLSQLLPRR